MQDPESLKGTRQSHYWVEKGHAVREQGAGYPSLCWCVHEALGLQGPGALSLETQAQGTAPFHPPPLCLCRGPWVLQEALAAVGLD